MNRHDSDFILGRICLDIFCVAIFLSKGDVFIETVKPFEIILLILRSNVKKLVEIFTPHLAVRVGSHVV